MFLGNKYRPYAAFERVLIRFWKLRALCVKYQKRPVRRESIKDMENALFTSKTLVL